tara:strand:- start:240 stop:458 length:219 start_codon:yes stop_codon:yes gene_type:complete
MKKVKILDHEIIGITQKDLDRKLRGTGCECMIAVSVIRNKKTGICYPIGYGVRGNPKLEKDVNKAIAKLTNF